MSEDREDATSMFRSLILSLGGISLPGTRPHTPQPHSSASTSPTFTISPASRRSTFQTALFGASLSANASRSIPWADRGKLDDLSQLASRASKLYPKREHSNMTAKIWEQIHSHCSTVVHVNHGSCTSGCKPVCLDGKHYPRIEVRLHRDRDRMVHEHELTGNSVRQLSLDTIAGQLTRLELDLHPDIQRGSHLKIGFRRWSYRWPLTLPRLLPTCSF
jgi:hypothetical protein